jgi:hypothetical protein
MGSLIELNDTLPISAEQGFPAHILDHKKHMKKPISLPTLNGIVFSFYKKDNARIYHTDPVRVFLVQNSDDKWLFWGKILIQSQSITKKLDNQGNWKTGEWETSGTYIITDIYEPEYQILFTRRESPPGRSYF